MNGLDKLKQYLTEVGAVGLWAHKFNMLGLTIATYSVNGKQLVIQETDKGRWEAFMPLGSSSDADTALDAVRAYCQPEPATPEAIHPPGDVAAADGPPLSESPYSDGLRRAFTRFDKRQVGGAR